MLNLSAQTEINKTLPKNAIFQKLMLNTAGKASFDKDILRINIANEISERTINIAKGKSIDSIFVLLVHLKKKEYADKNITLLSKMIERNIVYVMKFEEEYQLGVYYTKLIKSEWTTSPALAIAGFDLDVVWENIVKVIGRIDIEQGNSLEEQIVINEQQEKILKQIDLLEKKMRNTKQFNEQVKIKNEIKRLKKELEKMQ